MSKGIFGLVLAALLVLPVSVSAAPKSSKSVAARAVIVTPTPILMATPVPVALNEQPIRVVQTEPVSFTLPVVVWLAWIISIGSVIGAVAVIWKFIISASKIISNIANYQSVLLDIAHEFKADAGSTLRDSLDRLESAAQKAQSTAEQAQKTVDSLTQFLREKVINLRV
jgi:hypothetical protein